jgi:hypothetical protein
LVQISFVDLPVLMESRTHSIHLQVCAWQPDVT